MALSGMIRKVYRSSVVSLTLRAIGSSAFLNGSLNVQSHNFCSLTTAKDLVDTSIYKALKNQIKYAKSELKNQAIIPPESFPFIIEEDIDHPSSRVLRLIRKFLDEDIVVYIDASELNIEEEIESDDEFSSSDDSSEDDNDISCDKKRDGPSEKGSNDDDDGGSKPKTDREVDDDDDRVVAAIPMSVTIEKANGDKSLSFNITFSTEDIVIHSFDIYNYENDDNAINLEGSKFKDLDFELQQSLYKYLEIRGIQVNMARFLLKYIAQKKKKADLVALKHIKNVIKH